MSALHMFLPASEPARSEALALLQKTHHVPRHLVRGLARGATLGSKRALALGPAQQMQGAPSVAGVTVEAPPTQAQAD